MGGSSPFPPGIIIGDRISIFASKAWVESRGEHRLASLYGDMYEAAGPAAMTGRSSGCGTSLWIAIGTGTVPLWRFSCITTSFSVTGGVGPALAVSATTGVISVNAWSAPAARDFKSKTSTLPGSGDAVAMLRSPVSSSSTSDGRSMSCPALRGALGPEELAAEDSDSSDTVLPSSSVSSDGSASCAPIAEISGFLPPSSASNSIRSPPLGLIIGRPLDFLRREPATQLTLGGRDIEGGGVTDGRRITCLAAIIGLPFGTTSSGS
jgi:hypothetical protein